MKYSYFLFFLLFCLKMNLGAVLADCAKHEQNSRNTIQWFIRKNSHIKK